MDFEAFTGMVKKAMEEYMGESVRADITYVTKNNGLRLCGLLLAQEKGNVALTIYLDSFYDDYKSGKSLGGIVKEIIDIYEKNKGSGFIDMSIFTNYEKMRPKLGYRMVNYEKNKEMLKECPHERFLDLAAVVSCYMLNDWGNSTSFLLHNRLLEKLHVEPSVLHQDARKNMQKLLPPRIEPMGNHVNELRRIAVRDCMEEMLKDQIEQQGDEWFEVVIGDIQGCIRQHDHDVEHGRCMYLLTNTINYYGAAVLLYDHFLERLGDELGSNFYIFPSSVDDVIAMTETGTEIKELLYRMVAEANRQVQREKILSYSVYYFDRQKGTLSILE